MNDLIYPIIFSFEPIYNGWYISECPRFPEDFNYTNMIEDEDFSEMLCIAELSIKEHIAACIENNTAYPEPFTESELLELYKNNPDKIITLIRVDIFECLKKYSKTLVKKTLTIPEYVNNYGIKHGLNFSALLTDAIIRKMD